ncbi:MAG: type VI secretion protein IcmF/TssM N-terminal domain-containing protein, partial [Arenicellales bacterium]
MRWFKKILIWLAFVLLLFATLVVGTLLGWSENTQLLVTGSAFFAGLVIFVYRRVQSWLPVVSLVLIWLILGLSLPLAWSGTVQLGGIGLVLVVALAIRFYQWIQDRRSAARMEQALKGAGARDGNAEELDRVAQELEAEIKALKLPGSEEVEAPYNLPWFMVVGPPSAGKTSAIAHSGLEFTRPTGSSGEATSSGCELVVGQEAVLVDTAGRYMTGEEDGEEWRVLLKTLEKHHRQKPINGILLCLSISDIMAADEGWDLESITTKLRTRLAEMMRHLGVNSPIYVVFTKCDLLLGFEAFFEDLEPHEKNQAWGYTVPHQERASANPREIFAREFDRLVEVLADKRLARLGGEMAESDKANVYLFHMEFAAARDRLAGFIDELFWTHSYQEEPMFRGFYFTSSIQEGSPTGHVLTSITQQFDPGAPPPSMPPA